MSLTFRSIMAGALSAVMAACASPKDVQEHIKSSPTKIQEISPGCKVIVTPGKDPKKQPCINSASTNDLG